MTLDKTMEFDHVIRVHDDGTVTDEPGIYAPTLEDDVLDSDRWEFFSAGYSGQHGYSGPIMHDSEYIGGRLERDILWTPGVYVAVVACWSPESYDDGQTTMEGWAVVTLKD